MTFNVKIAALAVALVATLGLTTDADAQKLKSFKERAGGTTSDAGNRCPGGTYNSCVAARKKAGRSNTQAANQCSRTCAQK